MLEFLAKKKKTKTISTSLDNVRFETLLQFQSDQGRGAFVTYKVHVSAFLILSEISSLYHF